jgi:TonB-dependent receptor
MKLVFAAVILAVCFVPVLSAENTPSLKDGLVPACAAAADSVHSPADSARRATGGDSSQHALVNDSTVRPKDSLSATKAQDSARTAAAPDSLRRQTTRGTVAGRVIDGVSQAAINGATITAFGIAAATIKTDKAGSFSLACDSAGPLTLSVYFPGYITDTITVKFTGGDTRLSAIPLWNSTKSLDKMVVVGKTEGQASAFNKEKNSDNLKNVIDAELIQKLPDQSTADALQRVPGISIQRDQGEGKYVQIRGTEARLSTVTINGQSIASPDAQTRAVALNVIPADQLAEIEVSKVLTPDMDGDAIGGTVNLITSTASDTNWREKLNLTPGYTQLSNTPIYQGSGSIAKCFLEDGRLGIFLGGSYYRDQKETQDVELDWDTSSYNPKGVGGSYLNTMQYRDYSKTNERIGANGRLDYRFSPETNAFLVGSFNRYGIQEDRRTLGFDLEDQDARPMVPDKDVVGEVPTTRSIKDTYKEQNIASATLGGVTKIGGICIDGNVAYSHAASSEPNEMTVTFERSSGLSYHFDHSNADRPTFEPVIINQYQAGILSGAEVFDYDSSFNKMKYFTMSSAKIENTQSAENSYSGQFNVKKPFELGFGDLEVKAGAKVLDHYKDQTLRATTYFDSGSYHTPNLTAFVGSYSNNDFYNNLYAMNNMPDPGLVRAYLGSPHYLNNIVNPTNKFSDSLSHLSSDPETFSANDFNGAGYGMATLKTDLWTVKGGVRFEYTSMHYSGYGDTVNTSNKWTKTLIIDMYKNFFFPLPMVLAKYSPDKDMNVRASYTRSFSRPEWYDLVPHIVYNDDDNVHTAIEGNPDLRPTTSDNVDLSWEYYFNHKKSVLYAGTFFKQMHDYIFTSELDTFFNQSKSTWAYYAKVNGGTANLAGLELELQSQFFFLPSFLSGFGMSGNYIYTWSKTLLPMLDQWTSLPGQSEHVGNAALFYEKYGFSARVALNYQSHCIVQLINALDHFGNVYVDDHLQLDCSASQKISKNVTAVVEFKNLTNAPKKLYLLNPQHTTQMEYYGWSGLCSVRLNF